jgi:uncharacterized Zn finger protein (UPF0148 family)
MKYCTNCGSELQEGTKFCTSCGQKVAATTVKEKVKPPTTKKTEVLVDIKPKELKRINDTIIKNNQSHIVRNSKYVAAFFALIVILAFMDTEALPIHPAIVMISIFLCISALIVGYMFRQREKKLQTLISGEAVLASWTLNQKEKLAYVNTLHTHETSKNKAMFTVITIFMVVIFGAFILFMEEGKGFMTLMMLGIIGFVALFAFGMPGYYKRKNMKGDGQVLIGDKFAYINGFFHNWDFPLSGINKVKIMDQPFYGLYLEYYYTDRTLTNTETIQIPAPRDVDLQSLINRFND